MKSYSQLRIRIWLYSVTIFFGTFFLILSKRLFREDEVCTVRYNIKNYKFPYIYEAR